MSHFSRLALCLGPQGLQRLMRSWILVCGLGAVGSMAVEALVRSGIGRLTLIDFDRFDSTNINRQILALDSTVGHSKVSVTAGRVREIAPDCMVEPLEIFLDAASVPLVLERPADVIIDAIDTVASKTELLLRLQASGRAVVSSMGAALRMDPTRVRVDDLSSTRVCPLARTIRRTLASHGVTTGIRCVFSEEPPIKSTRLPPHESNGLLDAPGPRPLGSFMPVTAAFGLAAAAEAIRLILDTEPDRP
ncbi:MAG: tRNA threonylcarbamoyladenosine dehydratase [Deltaproteobacteria bacterium]|nr:tRNA threonylcarbamoyladenosine dehydratase [Deltaproteobacteria bacterium]